MMELQEYRKYMAREELHKSLNSLVGLLGGIVSDDKVVIVNENDFWDEF